jgi:diguanylate cyclase (GGDEF)-like protein/PAS domain S-box-containing protein
MRLPARLALTGTVCMLLAVGVLGITMNRAALQTAENVHRADVVALASNNCSLIDQYIRQSAQELTQLLIGYSPSLSPKDPEDEEVLNRLVSRSAFFRFGAAFVDLDGYLRSRTAGLRALPARDDPGYASLFESVARGGTGVSGVLQSEDTALVAIGVPAVSDGRVRGALIGFSNLRSNLLQGFILQLSAGGAMVGIVDSRGLAVADTDQARISLAVNSTIVAAWWRAESRPEKPEIVEFSHDGQQMMGIVVAGLPGGWGFYQAKPSSEFYGPVRSRSTQLNLVLLVLVLVAAISLTVAGYRETAAHRRAETRFSALVRNATDLITVVNREGDITYDSPSVSSSLGVAPNARLGQRLLTSVHPDDQRVVGARLEALPLREGGIDRFECRVRRADRSYLWVDMSASNLLHDPAIRGIVVNGRDVSDQRRLQEQLSYQAQHDPLTGLPNRQVFADRLRLAAAGHGLIAVLFIDLDRFKWVNDEWGHDVGDEVLRRVARRLAGCVRAEDTLARVGGDEFVILLDGIDGEQVALEVAERIVAAMSRPFPMPEGVIRIGASVGISTNPGRPDQDLPVDSVELALVADELVRAADGAMYRAKQAGGLGYRVASTPASA